MPYGLATPARARQAATARRHANQVKQRSLQLHGWRRRDAAYGAPYNAARLDAQFGDRRAHFLKASA